MDLSDERRGGTRPDGRPLDTIEEFSQLRRQRRAQVVARVGEFERELGGVQEQSAQAGLPQRLVRLGVTIFLVARDRAA
jgi:hypothetical protein